VWSSCLQFLIHASSSICICLVWRICMMPGPFLMCAASASERVLADSIQKSSRSPGSVFRYIHINMCIYTYTLFIHGVDTYVYIQSAYVHLGRVSRYIQINICIYIYTFFIHTVDTYVYIQSVYVHLYMYMYNIQSIYVYVYMYDLCMVLNKLHPTRFHKAEWNAKVSAIHTIWTLCQIPCVHWNDLCMALNKLHPMRFPRQTQM